MSSRNLLENRGFERRGFSFFKEQTFFQRKKNFSEVLFGDTVFQRRPSGDFLKANSNNFYKKGPLRNFSREIREKIIKWSSKGRQYLRKKI